MGKKYFHNLPLDAKDAFHVAIVTPVIHYCMGGLKINDASECLGKEDKVIGGLYGAGEAAGGIHGSNRLGGNSLLDCVVFGRVSGRSAARYFTAQNIKYIESMKAGTAAASKLELTARLPHDAQMGFPRHREVALEMWLLATHLVTAAWLSPCAHCPHAPER